LRIGREANFDLPVVHEFASNARLAVLGDLAALSISIIVSR
jgi:hypothetical protein